MASVRTIREGLAAVCATVTGLNAYDRPVEEFTSPAAMILPPERVEYHQDATGSMVMWFPIRLAISRTQLDTAQDTLDALISPGTITTSLIDAIDQSGHHSFAWDYAAVDHTRNYGPYSEGNLAYLGCEVVVEVRA